LFEKRADVQAWELLENPWLQQFPMRDNDTRSISGRGAVRLENDRICVFERNGIYQDRIRTEANRYLWRSLKTRNES